MSFINQITTDHFAIDTETDVVLSDEDSDGCNVSMV
jgi:hypothetical protein